MNVQKKQAHRPIADISNAEWTWVIWVALILSIVVSIPFVWALWQNHTLADYQFMGFVTNPLDGGTYLSKIQLGKEGFWRTYFRHSPIASEGAYLDVLYTTLGHISRFLGLSNLFAFHAFRLVATFLMFLGLYQFGAVVWQRVPTRHLFLLLVSVGSGFGWIYVFFVNVDGLAVPDLTVPEAFPLYSAMANVHFPLAFSLIAISAAVIIQVFRPGFDDDPTVENGGLALFLSAFILAMIAPHALVPLALAVVVLTMIHSVQARRIHRYQFLWLMMMVLPAAPFALYYMAEVRYNVIVGMWSLQNQTLSPSPLVFAIGLGLPLILAVPGIVRAVRWFEPDGDQFVLLWLAMIILMLYLPTDVQRRFSVGMMIPVTYFAVRGLEDFWLKRFKKAWRGQVLAVVYGVSALSYVFLILLSFVGASSPQMSQIFLDSDYVAAFDWLDAQTPHDEVVLASEQVGAWLPGWAGMRVIYGHPFETLNAEHNLEQVKLWYAVEDTTSPVCEDILTDFSVRYVLVGPSEQAYGAMACVDNMAVVEQFGDVTIYEP